MKIEITVALVGLLGAFCGMLISVYVVRYMLTTTAKHRFAAAFTDELTILKSGKKVVNDCATMQLLEGSFSKHSKAYIELWSVLDCFGKWRIEKKWDTYKYGKGNNRNNERFLYLVPVKGKDEATVIKIASKHIESLIS